MAASLREQITTTSRGKVPTQDPDRTTGVSIEKGLISPAKRSLKHISGGEAAFRSVLMGAMIGTPIADSKAVDGAITVLDNGTAAIHERAVSTFSATLEQAANTVSPEFMLEQVTQAVQTYEKKYDEAWVNTPEETVRRAAEARGYNPDEFTGGRSRIFLLDAEKIRLRMEAGEDVTAFEILEMLIFQSLGRYETIDGRVIAVWNDGEKEYSSKQDAWEDIFSTQTLRNVMNETLATLAGSQADASDPAAPTATQEPAGDPTDSPTEAPSTPTDKPEPSATPDIATPEPVPTEQQNLDISNEVDQITVIEQTTQSDKYVYVNETTITPPEGVTLEGGRSVFLDNANIQREVIREQGLAPGYTSVHVRSDELVNTVTTFDQAGTSIYVPVISVDGQTFYSSSTSKAYFNVEIPEGAKPKYEAVSLPPNTNPESVTVRFQGEAEILEVTDNVGNQWVWDFRKGEFVSMIDRPSNVEMSRIIEYYVDKYPEISQQGQEELFNSTAAVIDRLVEVSGTGKDGVQYKLLFDEATSVPLFVKTQNESGEWTWTKADVGILARLSGRLVGTPIEPSNLNDLDYDQLINDFSTIIENDVYWDKVIKEGETIEHIIELIKSGDNVSAEKVFDFSEYDIRIRYANKNNMSVISQPLFSPAVIPDQIKQDIASGKLSETDFELFLQFYTQSLVSRYNGELDPMLKVDNWVVGNEVTGNWMWADETTRSIMDMAINKGILARMFVTAHEANPTANLLFSEDHLLERQESELRSNFIRFIDIMKGQGAPINGVAIQNHLWIGRELLSEGDIENYFRKLEERGLSINYNEITISISQKNQYTGETVDTPFDDPYRTQAEYLDRILTPMQNRDGAVLFYSITDTPGPFDTYNLNDPTANAVMFVDYYKKEPRPMYYVLLKFLSQGLD